MYYYVLDGESYETYEKTVFMSKTRYTHDEFLEIVKKAYKLTCEEICKEYNISERCDFLISAYTLWYDSFNEIVERISDLEVIHGDECIHVGLSITPNENTWEILGTLQSLGIPECKNNCKTDESYKKYHCVYGGGL